MFASNFSATAHKRCGWTKITAIQNLIKVLKTSKDSVFE